MSVTHSLTLAINVGSTTLSNTVAKTAGQEINIDESIPNSSNDLAVAFAIVRDKLKSLYMVSDKAITVETNNGTTPDDIFSLVANEPVVWHENGGMAVSSFLAADITSLFVTNSSGAAAQLQIRSLSDPT